MIDTAWGVLFYWLVLQMPRSYSSSNILAALPINGTSVQLYTPPSETMGQELAKYDGTIESLTVLVKIQSLLQLELPAFDLADDDSVRFNAVRDLQYQNPRFELQILLSNAAGVTPVPIAHLPLMNMQRSGYTLDLLAAIGSPIAYRVAYGASLWAKIHNVGYGFPTSADSFVIHGCANEEAYTTAEELNNLGYQRHTAITLLGMRAANLAKVLQDLVDSWDGRIQVTVNSSNTFYQNVLQTFPPQVDGVGPSIFDAIVVGRDGSVATSGGKVWINPLLLPAGFDDTVFEAITVNPDGKVATLNGNVVFNPALVPAGFDSDLFAKIVVGLDGQVVTYNGYVVYTD